MRQMLVSLRRLGTRLGLERDWYIILLSMIIGLLMGGVAVLFIMPLHAIEDWVKDAPASTLRWLVPTAPIGMSSPWNCIGAGWGSGACPATTDTNAKLPIIRSFL